MKEPLKITVFFDFICPWCYVGAVRLYQIKEEYGDRIEMTWKGFPLLFGGVPGEGPSPRANEGRHRAGLEETGINFRPWHPSQPYPTSSIPALEAAKCAQLQGEAAWYRFHLAVFKAFFEQSRNISDREVLLSLAKETGLDVDQFRATLDQGSPRKEVLAEFEEGVKYAGWGVPLVIIGGHYPIVGAAPVDVYRQIIDRLLASQPG